MLARVLKRLETAEVHGRLDGRRVAGDAVGIHGGGEGRSPGGGRQGLAEPSIDQQRRVDTVSQVTQLLHGLLQIVAQLVEHLAGRGGVRASQLSGKPQFHRERDEMLLRPVVQVAFDLTAAGVGGRDDARSRLTQLVGLPAHLFK